MKANKILLIWVFVLGLTACEDKLDILKHGNLGAIEEFYRTDNEALEGLAALYSRWYSTHDGAWMMKNVLSDDVWCGGEGRGDNTNLHYLNEYIFGSENGNIEGYYSNLYGIIYNANILIERVQPDSEAKKRVIAEAKFFRAFAHFELVTLWGTAPVVDHVLLPSEYHKAPGTPAAHWSLIEKDLNEAIQSNSLPSKSSINDRATGIRITKETALAWLGKAYVFQKKWPEAATTLDMVINSGLYGLYGVDQTGQYEDVILMPADNSCESVLEGEIKNDAQRLWNRFPTIFIMGGWRMSKLTITPGSWAASNIALGTYGFFNPKKELYDAFVAREGINGYRLNQTILTHAQLNTIGVTLNQSLHGHDGYFFWKNRVVNRDLIYPFPGYNVTQHTNKRVMRFAEVLLLAAEAHLKSSTPNQARALTYVNRIRQRAQLPDLATVTMDDVKIEKRLELCNEAVRFQDLVRWGDAAMVLANQGKDVYTYNGTTNTRSIEYSNTKYGFKVGQHELLPIPAKEILLNKNMKQNPKW